MGRVYYESAMLRIYEDRSGWNREVAAKSFENALQDLKSAADYGNPQAMISYGERQPDMSAKIGWYKAAATALYGPAFSKLRTFDFGISKSAQSTKGHKDLVREARLNAANKGDILSLADVYENPVAMLLAGFAYRDGIWGPADPAEANRYYLRSARKDNSRAMVAYADGLADTNSDKLYWLKKSASAGNAYGQLILAYYYQRTRSETQSEINRLIRKAANSGLQEAKDALPRNSTGYSNNSSSQQTCQTAPRIGPDGSYLGEGYTYCN